MQQPHKAPPDYTPRALLTCPLLDALLHRRLGIIHRIEQMSRSPSPMARDAIANLEAILQGRSP